MGVLVAVHGKGDDLVMKQEQRKRLKRVNGGDRTCSDYQCTAELSHRNGLYYKTVALLRDSPAILFYTLGYIRYIHITSQV